MRGSVHLALSAAMAYPVCWAVTRSPEAALPLALAVGAASLLNDLDHGAGLAAGILRVRWLSGLVQATVGHRGPLTHSVAACSVWALLWGILAGALTAGMGQEASLSWAGGAFLVVLAGGLLHVAADSLTPAGVPAFWPLSRRRYRFRLRRLRPPARPARGHDTGAGGTSRRASSPGARAAPPPVGGC